MVNLASTETFVFPVNRQDLFNLWANATMGTFPKSEIDPSVFTMDIGTSLSDATSVPQPGQHFWSKWDGLMYVWHDEVDDTGVSLWLAIGPDRFDVACIAHEPLGAGAIVEPVYDRWVKTFTGASSRPELQRAIGTVPAEIELVTFGANFYALTGNTTASGSWVPVSIDGIVWVQHDGGEVLEEDRWVRVKDGTPGRTQRTEQATNPAPLKDDVVGMGLNTVIGKAEIFFPLVLWTGPRVYSALDT